MKKSRFMVLVAVISLSVLSCCAFGATTIFEENFESGTPGTVITGWSNTTAANAFRYSSTEIGTDLGQSAILGGAGAEVRHIKNLSETYIIGANDIVSFTAVVKTPRANGAYTYFDVISQQSPGGATQYWRNYVYTDNKFWWYGPTGGTETLSGSAVIPSTAAVVLDMRIDFSAAGTDFYYKDHGAVDWSFIANSPYAPTNIKQVAIAGKAASASYLPAYDSLKIEVTTVPEPGTLLALSTGLIGLAGFAVRRKR